MLEHDPGTSVRPRVTTEGRLFGNHAVAAEVGPSPAVYGENRARQLSQAALRGFRRGLGAAVAWCCAAGVRFHGHHVAGTALQRLLPYQPGRGEQDALPEADVVIEQVDDRAIVLDLRGDQVDAEAPEQIGEVGRVNIGGRGTLAAEQQLGRRLDEAEAA